MADPNAPAAGRRIVDVLRARRVKAAWRREHLSTPGGRALGPVQGSRAVRLVFGLASPPRPVVNMSQAAVRRRERVRMAEEAKWAGAQRGAYGSYLPAAEVRARRVAAMPEALRRAHLEAPGLLARIVAEEARWLGGVVPAGRVYERYAEVAGGGGLTSRSLLSHLRRLVAAGELGSRLVSLGKSGVGPSGRRFEYWPINLSGAGDRL